MRSLLTGLVPVFLCACAMSPAQCRNVGVSVQDSDLITGTIIEEHIADQQTVQARCMSPFQARYGCSIAVNPGQYVIWCVPSAYARDHERCHALYEEKRHAE